MMSDTQYHLAREFDATLHRNGTVTIRSEEGIPILLAPQAVSFLLAFAAGATPTEAASVAGLDWTAQVADVFGELCRRRFIESTSVTHSVPRVDARNEASRTYFDAHARTWTERAYAEARRDSFAFHRVEAALRWIAGGSANQTVRVIDLGCGPGFFLVEAARAGCNTIGVDSSPEMLRLCNARVQEVAPSIGERITVYLSDVESYRAAAPVDVVTAFGLIAWFDDPTPVFRTAHACLRPGGLFVVDCASSLVTPDGVRWMSDAAGVHDSISLLVTAARRHFDGAAHRWLPTYMAGVEHAIAELRAIGAADRCGEVRRMGESRNGQERRVSPADVKRLADRVGFEVVDFAGVGEIRSVWNDILVEAQAEAMNLALTGVRATAIGALWTTGFLALLRATECQPQATNRV
jgi:SAM-dependent methyltransferase